MDLQCTLVVVMGALRCLVTNSAVSPEHVVEKPALIVFIQVAGMIGISS